MKKALHQFLTWAPPALGAGLLGVIVGIPATYPETKGWFVAQGKGIWSWVTAHQTLAIVLAILVFVLWLVAFILTAEDERPPLGTLEDVQPNVTVDQSGDLVAVAAIPPQAHPTVPINLNVNNVVSISETTSPTLSAGPSMGARLYVGVIIVSAGQLADEGHLELAIRAFNGTGATVRVAAVEGRLRGGVGNSEAMELPPTEWQTSFSADDVAPQTEFMVVLRQPLDEQTAQQFLNAFEQDFVALDLRGLDVHIQNVEGEGSARLPLWDGVTLRRRDDIFTGRLFMMAITAAVETSASIG